MFSTTLLTAALFITPAIQGALAFAISSPDFVQCQSAAISWEPTKGPYNLIVVPASDPCGDALVNVGDFSTTLINWTASIAAGTQVQLSLVDADDNEAWSKNITVGDSSDTSCLSAAIAVPSAAATTPSAGADTASAATGTDSAASTSTSSAGDSNSGVVPIGAANAGTLGGSSSVNGAFTVRQVSAPLMVISGLVAAFALSL